jgi:hypothetical protein
MREVSVRTAGVLVQTILACALAGGLAGCVGAAAAAAIAPTVFSGATFAAVHGARAASGDETPKETEERCEELVRGTPGVSEVRRAPDGSIATRAMVLMHNGAEGRWMFSNGRADDVAAHASFTPPLHEVVREDETRYLAYAPAVAETAAESDQATTLVVVFGQIDGTLRANQRAYSYAVVAKLPCYPAPE